MIGFNEFENDLNVACHCKKMPDDLEKVFRESPPGLRAYYKRFAMADGPLSECYINCELEFCDSWESCKHLSECARGFIGRMAAGWHWNLSETTEM
jgi:hypothetical protein